MGGVDKLQAPIGGRPLLAWTLRALAGGAGGPRGSSSSSAADRVADLAAAPWLPAARHGGRRRGEPAPGLGRRRRRGAAGRRTRRRRPRPRRGAPARLARARRSASRPRPRRHGAAIPVVPVAETLKRVEDGRIAATVDRTALAAAQTPQGVRRDVLARAWAIAPARRRPTWTDEAALLEACRIPVHVVPGEPTNLKVTLPDDLARVEAALVARGSVAASRRPSASASATTATRSGPGWPLALGGIVIDGAPRLHGHSDGDVVAPRGLRRAARCGRPRRPRPHFPAGPRDAGGDRQPRAGRGLPRAGPRRRLGPGLGRPDDRGGPAAAGRPARRDGGGDRRPPRPPGGPGQRQGVDRQPRRLRGRRARDRGARRRPGRAGRVVEAAP